MFLQVRGTLPEGGESLRAKLLSCCGCGFRAVLQDAPGALREDLKGTLDVPQLLPSGSSAQCEGRNPSYPLSLFSLSRGAVLGRVSREMVRIIVGELPCWEDIGPRAMRTRGGVFGVRGARVCPGAQALKPHSRNL